MGHFVTCNPNQTQTKKSGYNNIRTVDRDTLVDIRDVKIDRSLPLEERVRSFVEQIKNPYCFRCGDAVVKTSFLDTDVTLEDCVESYLRNL